MAWQWAARSKGLRTGNGMTLGASGVGGQGRARVAGGAGAGRRLRPTVVALTPARWRGRQRRVAALPYHGDTTDSGRSAPPAPAPAPNPPFSPLLPATRLVER